MTTQQPPQYLRDPMYKEAMRHLQTGAFQEGLSSLELLKKRYPHEAKHLDELHAEMLIRSHIDEYEVEEDRLLRNQRLKSIGVYSLLSIVVIALVVWSIGTYAGFVTDQVDLARQEVEAQSEYMQLLATYRNAQNLYRAGRAIEALDNFQRVDALLLTQDYPRESETFINLPVELEQATTMADIENKYNLAQEALAQGDRSGALSIFREISLWNSRYRDVGLQIEELEKYFEAEVQFQIAEGSFAASNWEDAVSKFETIRSENPSYEPERVEGRLFESYLEAAQAILEKEETPEQLKIAEAYFAKALELRPQDSSTLTMRTLARKAVEDALIETYLHAAEQALLEQADSLVALQLADSYFFKAAQVRPGDTSITVKHEMARRYLEAIEDFNRGDWDLVIKALEFVYGEDAKFAAGTAAQTLYDSYLARGSANVGSAEYEAAMLDFQRAAEIANSTPEADLLLVKARAELARTLGLLARFEEAVQLYQEAVEQAGLVERAQLSSQEIFNLLANAQALSDLGNYKSAYNYYRNAFENLVDLLTTSTHTVKEGEYLTQLARQYGTTVEAIMEANQISSRRIEKDQELIIPNLEDEP